MKSKALNLIMTKRFAFVRSRSAVRRKGALVLFVTVCMLGLGLTASGQEPKIITFDAPGADLKPGDFNGTFPSGINNGGDVTGYYIDANNVVHGFLRSHEGTFTTFEAPGADTTPGTLNGTGANSITDSGAITGNYLDAKGFSHGFVRSRDGKFTTFDVPGGSGTFPIAMNPQGAIVGFYSDSNLNFNPFLRSPNGTFTKWNAPGRCENGTPNGCFGSSASNINGFGIAVGGYQDNSGNFVGHGLIRHPDGTLTTFDVPGAGTGLNQGSSCPGCFKGLNPSGEIAGPYIDANSVQHGFLRSPDGTFTTFDAPDAGTGTFEGTGCPSDCPTSLNASGAITGTYIDANFVFHGYLRSRDGKIVTVDPLGSVFTESFSINDPGSITGFYLDANNVFHGFLRIPH